MKWWREGRRHRRIVGVAPYMVHRRTTNNVYVWRAARNPRAETRAHRRRCYSAALKARRYAPCRGAQERKEGEVAVVRKVVGERQLCHARAQ